MIPSAHIRSLVASDAPACDAIVASLPEWFGMPEGIRDCAEAVRSQPGFVIEQDGSVIAFITVTRPRARSAEISWLAVHAEHRGRGHGRALVEALVAQLQAEAVRFLLVKTLSDRHSDPGYAETRAFYEALGFTSLSDLDIWGPDNPALLLARSIAAAPSHDVGATTPSAEDLVVAARIGAERLTPQQAHAELQAGAILIDHRTLEQRGADGDVPGAVHVSMTVVPWVLDPQSPWRLKQIADHDTRVVLMCQEGYSSSLSAVWLRDLGMRRVADVVGGFEAWRDAGLPVTPLQTE